jgi:hypothetical protein
VNEKPEKADSLAFLIASLESDIGGGQISADEERDRLATHARAAGLARLMFEWVIRNRDHPVAGLFEQFGNGIFEDDHSVRSEIPAPHFFVYRFRHGSQTAYIWHEGEIWFVSPWRHMKRRRHRTVETVESFRAALDRLLPLPRPWWKFWS